MLDTDICSYIMKRSNAALLNKLKATPVNEISISVVTKSELLYGAEVSPSKARDTKAVDAFLRHTAVLDFPDEAASHYADIRAHLKKSGSMIGANDLFIAAHARCLGLVLVTNNMSEFGRVQRLKTANWVG